MLDVPRKHFAHNTSSTYAERVTLVRGTLPAGDVRFGLGYLGIRAVHFHDKNSDRLLLLRVANLSQGVMLYML